MSFRDFAGNSALVASARRQLARGRFPRSLVLAGPPGAGKYTLAQMLTKAMFCVAPPAGELPDFCGACSACRRLAQADDLEQRVAEAVEAREAMREADRRETRLLLQTHPDVLVIPPDPPQMMIKVDQVRRLTASLPLLPAEGRQRVFIFTASAFMKEAANALLKALEEPPDYAVIFLLSSNPGELLPTLRSRCATLRLAPLATAEIEALLAERRPQLAQKERALVAGLAAGAVGRALTFDLAGFLNLRRDALLLVNSARGNGHAALFQMTEAYRGNRQAAAMEDLLRALRLLLQDLLYLKSERTDAVRNRDITRELAALAASVDFDWIRRAADSLAALERSLRRNILRPLALDALAAALEAY